MAHLQPESVPLFYWKEWHIINWFIQYSAISLFVYCENCDSYENHRVKSKTQFLEIIKKSKINNYRSSFKCEYCTQREVEQINLEKIQSHQQLIEKAELAIDGKNWTRLSNFEKTILGDCLKMDFNQLKKHYGSQLGQEKFILFIRALEKIEEQNLIFLTRNSYSNYVVNFQCLRRLSEYKEEILFKDKIPSSSCAIDNETNEIKFKLTINDRQNHPDSPKYAGTVTFKERIVMEPEVEYIFGVWPRANENLYLTMTPLENLEKTAQTKRINSQPISLQDGISDFLNRLGKDF